MGVVSQIAAIVAVAGVVVVALLVLSGNTVIGRIDRSNQISACRGNYSAKVSGAIAQEVRAFGAIAEAEQAHDGTRLTAAFNQLHTADHAFDTAYNAYLAANKDSATDPSAFLAHCHT